MNGGRPGNTTHLRSTVKLRHAFQSPKPSYAMRSRGSDRATVSVIAIITVQDSSLLKDNARQRLPVHITHRPKGSDQAKSLTPIRKRDMESFTSRQLQI